MFVGTDFPGQGGRDSNQREVLLFLPSREPLGFSPRKKACPVFGEPTGSCVREGEKSGRLPGGSVAGGGPRRAAVQVSANRIAKSLRPSLTASLGQPSSQVSWETRSQAV